MGSHDDLYYINREHLRLLIDDLENGGHNQARSALEVTDSNGNVSYCCLGRACRVAMANGVQLSVETILNEDHVSHLSSTASITYFNGNSYTMPDEVAEFYGFVRKSDDEPDHHPYAIDSDGKNKGLAEYNDEGKTLEYIAGLLRSNYMED